MARNFAQNLTIQSSDLVTSSFDLAAASRSVSLVALLGLSCVAATEPLPESIDEEKARIANVVEAIGFFADHDLFDRMCGVYSEQVVFDYSSLWGNESMLVNPGGAATAWSRFLPGFDTTRHQIDVDQVALTKETASAHAAVTADHWLAGELWSITGFYDADLRKTGDGWKIHSWKFTLHTERGNRGLVYEARDLAEGLIARPIICDAPTLGSAGT